jgi:hypothetical protein
MDPKIELHLLTKRSEEIGRQIALITLSEEDRKKLLDELKANLERSNELMGQINKR